MNRLAQLEAARLLDWRFLLPEPLTGRWAVLGTPPSGLEAALAARPGCTVARGDAPAELDGIVARDPAPASLLPLVAGLRPGGLVYVEVSRGRPGPTTLRAWRRLLQRQDVDVLAVHWHAPSFAARTRIVPLHGRAGVRDTLARHEGLRLGRLRALAGQALLRVGALDLVVPCGSVLGRRR